MTDENQNAAAAADSESEIWNAIAAFEKILEAIPNDRVSLETLADAYEKVGDRTRAKEYLVRLANVLIDEQDEDAARDILRKLKEFDGGEDPVIAEMIGRLEDHKPEKVMAMVYDEEEATEKKSVNISEEISFAWNLLQAEKISQDDYSNIVHDLSENSTKTVAVPVSTLHVLNDRSFSNISEILAFASTDGKAPLVSLECFDINPDGAKLLNIDFCIRRGAICFELMGQDALVGILNPYDASLRNDVEDAAGRICHFFLCPPEDFDSALEKVKKMLADDEDESS